MAFVEGKNFYWFRKKNDLLNLLLKNSNFEITYTNKLLVGEKSKWFNANYVSK